MVDKVRHWCPGRSENSSALPEKLRGEIPPDLLTVVYSNARRVHGESSSKYAEACVVFFLSPPTRNIFFLRSFPISRIYVSPLFRIVVVYDVRRSVCRFRGGTLLDFSCSFRLRTQLVTTTYDLLSLLVLLICGHFFFVTLLQNRPLSSW
ncbi:unnamed protein product, partial [Ascophyllum nodosum]